MQQLKQSEIDLVLGLHWEEIVAIRQQLARIDDQRDGLAHIAEQYDQKKLVSVMLLDESGNVFFNHRTTPGESCQLTNNVIQECTAHLIRQLRKVFERDTPKPARPVATPEPKSEPGPASSDLVWHTKESLAKALGIAETSVYTTVHIKNIPKKRDGKRVLYGLPQ